MLKAGKLLDLLPLKVRNQVDTYQEALDACLQIRDPRVLMSLGPSGIRGLVLRRAQQGTPLKVPSNHSTHFDWRYPSDQPAMRELYDRAKSGQWDSRSLPWHIDVDPLNPEVPILPERFIQLDVLKEEYGIQLTPRERQQVLHSIISWNLSQFLHGEQAALYAAAQVTEAVQFFDGKLYGATQVMDEGRHVEVFHRYLDEKLNKLYVVNDNLYTIIDALISDGRWDMKFLGMQIMVEGLALGAFGTLYRQTQEPLLKELLKNVIQDEARHVHYGVLALREHITRELTERERNEREDWCFEIALLMRDRMMAYEVYEEWFEGRMRRDQWRRFITQMPGMQEFRKVMFSRLVPNLREIGLLSPRIMPRYEKVGLMAFFNGTSALELTGEKMIREFDQMGG